MKKIIVAVLVLTLLVGGGKLLTPSTSNAIDIKPMSCPGGGGGGGGDRYC